MYLTCPSWLLGILMVLTAIPLIWWSIRLWSHADSMKPDSLTYRLYVNWLRVWQPEVWRKRTPPGRLTIEDIRFFAVFSLLGGVALIVIGVMHLFEGYLLK